MMAAVEAGRAVGAEVVLADRDIQATLLRCYRSLGPLDRLKVLAVLLMLPFAAADIDEKQVEELKDRKAMGDVMETFARQMPSLKRPLIDERDQYLIASTREAPGPRVVSVIGAAHVPGMVRALDAPIDRAALSVLPGPSPGARAARFIWPAAIAAFLLALALRSPGALTNGALILAATTALGSGVLALVGGAHPLTALVAAVLSPPTLLVPGPHLGRLVGGAEARLRTPAPSDGARLRDDVLRPGRARNNSMLRPALVATFSTFGRGLGSAMGLLWGILRLS